MERPKHDALQITKELMIAKLSSAAPNHTSKEVGDEIGNMFQALYNKVYEITSAEEK